MNDPAESLRALLDRAWDDHAEHPRRVADMLSARASTLGADADAAAAIRLAEHVMLAHLAEPGTLRGFIAELSPGTPAIEPSVQRARWALARLDGTAEPALADAPRWRSLHNVVLAAAKRGHARQAAEWLTADESAAIAHPDAEARQAYAASANNIALDLRLDERGHADLDALMIQAAEVARRAWGAAGTWMHAERAEYQLAMCHAALGDGRRALAHARECQVICEREGADAVECFFAHEALSRAHHAARDAAAALDHRERMQRLLPEIEDAGMRDWCEQTLAALPG